jgi:3-isopropylmalate/(R)-2-methylmalate dehydratase large subunit
MLAAECKRMEIDDRMTLCNHAAEFGAKAAILEADQNNRGLAYRTWCQNSSTRFCRLRMLTMSKSIGLILASLSPQVARKDAVDDIVSVTEVHQQKIQFALIGTCTNGRLDDIRQQQPFLKEKKLLLVSE